MKVTFLKITSPVDIPLNVKELYIAAFPDTERRDWADIENRIATGDPVFSFYVLQHDSENVGFITIWRLPGMLYCEHLAILPQMRGLGLGADVVKEAIAMAGGNPLVLEVELPEASEEARRRISFYERCGLVALDDFPYWQPPYRRDLPEVPMMLMSSGPLTDPTAAVLILHTVVYNQ